jgi:16S rRNA (cytidine1402-2'-O)-methyltransferase
MLYIVATPIGNLQDITFRAIETLKHVDKIYCEDTRRTRLLLDHFSISKPTESYHHHSDHKIPGIIHELKNGFELAYVSDAGTPGLSDPAGKLVAAARAAGIDVVPLPGASAITTLLSVAGVYANEFRFAGYVPTKKGRQTFLRSILAEEVPVVFFETAPRFVKLLDELTTLGGEERVLVVGREVTKKFEEIVSETVTKLKDRFNAVAPRGEFVVVLTPQTSRA